MNSDIFVNEATATLYLTSGDPRMLASELNDALEKAAKDILNEFPQILNGYIVMHNITPIYAIRTEVIIVVTYRIYERGKNEQPR